MIVRPDGNPYVGPRPFEANDARFFFGRDAEVEDLLALILSNQVVLLYAASGAGKSSLLNAAVVPRLERDEQFEVLPVARFRGLREEIPADCNAFVSAVLSSLAPDGSTAESLHAYLGERPHSETTDGFAAPRALVIDQFEEIFTAYPERWEDRPGLFHDLAAALRDDPLLRVVLSIREDFVAQLDPYARLLPEGFRARYRLERLGHSAALRAVREPARAAGCAFADGVAQQLVGDLRKVRLDTEHGTKEVVDEFVEPVQLQVVAHGLWQALPDAATEITDEHRQRFGNVDEVLGAFYDHAIAAAAAAADVREDSLRERFGHTFITPMGTRGSVFWTRDETGGIPARAVEELDVRHLIRAELRAGARWYELTHDRLIEPIRASNRVREQRRRERRRRALMIAGGLLIGVVTAAVATAVVEVSNSSSEQTVTPTNTVTRVVTRAASSVQRLAQQPARVGSIKSITYTDGGRGLLVVGDAATATFDSDQLGRLRTTLAPKTGEQPWAVVERDGVRLEDFLKTDSVRGGRLVLAPRRELLEGGDGTTFLSIALSRGAHHAAVADASGTVRVVDTRTGAVVPHRPPPNMSYATPAFGADESTVLLLRSDGTINTASTERRTVRKLAKLESLPLGIAVDPGGQLIAAYGSGTQVELLDDRGKSIGILPAEDVVTAAFSPSGDRLVLGHRDGTIELWPTRAHLVFDDVQLTHGRRHSTVLADVRNNGASRSAATTLRLGAARKAVRALDAGKATRITVDIPTPRQGMPILVRLGPLPDGERPHTNTALYVWTSGDTRAQVVAAALTAALHPSEIQYETLQGRAFQGILDDVQLPSIPRSANSGMFATWCYWQARVADPSGVDYVTAFLEGGMLDRGHATSAPRPGDLVFYYATHASTAIYVGSARVVRWVDGHPKETPLDVPGQHPEIRTYNMARQFSAACTRADCRTTASG
jgi:Novel STAND NTPase 1